VTAAENDAKGTGHGPTGPVPAGVKRIQQAYSSVADVYIGLVGTSGQVHPDDLAFIERRAGNPIAGLPYPSAMTERSLRLSNGPGRAGRIIGVVVGVVFAAGGLLFAAMAAIGDRFLEGFGDTSRCVDPADVAGLPPYALPPDVAVCSGWLPDHIGWFGAAGLVVGGGFALIGLSVAMRSLRAASWLEGTVLRVRGAFRTRRIDLATADVTLGTVTQAVDDNHYHRVPTLVARDPASGRRVRLSLSGTGMDRLPPAELRAVAGAVTTARPVSEVDAWRVAAHLQQMADNPLDLPMR
jgi:hypothetical protein